MFVNQLAKELAQRRLQGSVIADVSVLICHVNVNLTKVYINITLY